MADVRRGHWPCHMKPISYARLHYPPSIVHHVVWLYLRVNLSLRDVEGLLAERGLDVSYETVRPRCCDDWHLDEVFVSVSAR